MSAKILVACLLASFALVASAELTDEQKEMMLAIHNECLKVSGATDEMGMNAMTGDFSEEPSFKEHLFCVAKKVGFMTENGELQPPVITEKLMMFIPDEAKAKEVVNMCAVKKGSPQETAFEMSRCLYKAKHAGK